MSARLLLVCLTTAALLAVAFPTAAGAKPPDLPLNPAITCASGAAPTAPDDTLIRAGIHAALGCPAGVLLDPLWLPRQDDDEPCTQPLDAAFSCVERMATGCCRVVSYYMAAAGSEEPAGDAKGSSDTELSFEAVITEVKGQPATKAPAGLSCPFGCGEPSCPAPEPPASGPTCPYLKKQSAEKKPAAPQAEALPKSALEELGTLVKAQKLYRRAEYFRQTGHPGMAALYYEKVKQLAPGNSYDVLASAQMVRMRARELTGEEPAEPEEQDVAPPEESLEPNEAPKLEAHARVTELLKRCERAFESGDYETAERLVLKAALRMQRLRRQMYTLTPAVPPSEPSEEQKPVCTPQQDPDDTADEVPDPGDVEEPPTQPYAEDADSAPAITLQPEFPPVDPKIVDALEKVLAEIGEPGTPRLVIEVEEPAGSAEEQEEEPVSQWPYVPSDVEMPSLYVAPPPQDLSIEDEEAPQDEPEADEDDVPPRDVNGLLRDVLEAFQQGACVEVDVNRPGSLRIRCEIQVGGVECRVMRDEAGHGYVICTLAPEASGDLRAAQLAHNQSIINWINSVSGNGVASEGDDEVAECEDPIDDSADDDLTP